MLMAFEPKSKPSDATTLHFVENALGTCFGGHRYVWSCFSIRKSSSDVVLGRSFGGFTSVDEKLNCWTYNLFLTGALIALPKALRVKDTEIIKKKGSS
mmetsp:Transcript_6140/g.12465  ORF Transcript_6140/g.12465 Transcript_6140/m.12465 type:complete len:98 (+) Transcript_6140:14-307(+)